MKRFFSAIGAAAKSMSAERAGERFEVAGKIVRCPHCGGDRFVEGSAQLNTSGLTFLGLDWANRSAATLACVACGRVEWFLVDPEPR